MLGKFALKRFAVYIICISTILSALYTDDIIVAFADGQYSLSVSPYGGGINRSISVRGNWKTPVDKGTVFFDSNGNSQMDIDEPRQVVSPAYCEGPSYGECYVYANLIVPRVKPGIYNIRYVSSSGTIDASPAQYKVVTPSLHSSSNKGGINRDITISSTALPGGDQGTIYFDSNNNGQLDSNEPSKGVQVDNLGSISTILKIPNIKPGIYTIRYVSSSGAIDVTPAQYQVVTPSLSSSSGKGGINRDIGIASSTLPGNDQGTIYFDSNNNGQLDSNEPSKGVQVNNVGDVSTSLKVPSVVPGAYTIRYVSSLGEIDVTPVKYQVITPSININPSQGGVGKGVQINGTNLSSYSSGIIYFDSNNNGLLDDGETNVQVSPDGQGVFSTSLKVPDVNPGSYYIRYTSNAEVVSVNDVQFTVQAPLLSISPNYGGGGVNQVVTINGNYFIPYSSGDVYFDSNNNELLDDGEPSSAVFANSGGIYSISLTVPDVTPGKYYIRYKSSSNTVTVTPVGFEVKAPTIVLTHSIGLVNTTVSINGYDFGEDTGIVYFDSNNNGQLDDGEPTKSVTAGSTGNFSTNLVVPDVEIGRYYVRYQSSTGKVAVVPRKFDVIKPDLSISSSTGLRGASIKVDGKNFAGQTQGVVYFDSNGNGQLDSGDRQSSVAITNGSFTTTLVVPSLPAGNYQIRFSGSVTADPETFTLVVPNLNLSVASGVQGTSVTVAGKDFLGQTQGTVYFDSNGNGQLDSSEPQAAVSISNNSFTTSLKVPNINPGTYKVRFSGAVTATPANFTVVAKPDLSISSSKGLRGTSIKVDGKNFVGQTQGVVYFDSNGNGQLDSGDRQSSVAITNGSFTTTLVVPSLPAGNYQIRFSGSVTADPETFTLVVPNLNLSVASGVQGTSVTVAGKDFLGQTQGTVYFDSNGNGQLDSSEPQAAVSISNNSFTTSLKVPNINPGTYKVRFSGAVTATPANFTVVAKPDLSISSSKGLRGTSIKVDGKNFVGQTQGVVYFDSNGNGQLDSGDRQSSVAITNGSFTTTLVVPSLPAGNYQIRFSGSVTADPETFTLVVPNLNLSVASGVQGTSVTVAGKDFLGQTQGTVYFDSNGNGKLDSLESKAAVNISNNSFTTSLKVPNINPGTYKVRFSGAVTATPANFTVVSP
ncbi:hypothetical protein [Bacillus sp. OTU530]|uniref:hypothetical protein n=1 Tax=Bacillus sp. OTU530 TaxID=3043862 RepID=UPI00313ED8D0